MENNTELIEVKSKSPAEMIQQVVANNGDLSKLEGLLTLQERWEANEARKAYHKAMAEFKKNPPHIEKDKTVSFNTSSGRTQYNHATLANVTNKINAALSAHGLTASWRVSQNGTISVTCRITHEQGHFEETTITAPADNSGSKNAIQQIGSTIAYLERYSVLALTGLATEEMDDDAQTSESIEYIDDQQQGQILDFINSIPGAKLDKFLSWLKVSKLEEIKKSDFQKAIKALEAKQKVKNESH